MVDGRDWDVFGWEVVVCLVRARGFLGGEGFLGSVFLGFRVSLLFSLFLFLLGGKIFSLLLLVRGLRGSEPWGWLWTRFSMVYFALGLQIHYDLAHYIFPCVYGLGDGAT